MKNKSKEKDYNFINMKKANTKKRAERQKKKRKNEREKRIKEINDKREQEQDTFDFDTEVVIGMTNKNNINKAKKTKQELSRKQQKLKKKRQRIKFILKLLTFIVLVSGAVIFAVTSPIFYVKNIKVENNNQISSDTIISLSGINYEKNIFKFLKKNAEKSIKENAYIENVKVTRILPGTVQISVEERQRNFNLEFLNGYAYINNQGYILEISNEKLNLPVIQGAITKEEEIVPGNRLEVEDLKKLEKVISIMDSAKKNNLDTKVTSIDISKENQYSIYLEEEKKTIHLGDATNLTQKMMIVPQILEQEKGVEGEIFVNEDSNNKLKIRFKEKV